MFRWQRALSAEISGYLLGNETQESVISARKHESRHCLLCGAALIRLVNIYSLMDVRIR